MVAENSSCGCVGDTLNFSCTVSGGASTVWQGSAFGNCRITLLHSHFASGSGASGTCNRGSMVAQSESYSINYSTNTSYYTSYLRVTAAHDLNNTDIQCLLHINSQLIPIGSYNISIISGTMLLTIIIVAIYYYFLIYVKHDYFRICAFTSNWYLFVSSELQSHFICMDSSCFTLSAFHFLYLCIQLWWMP